MSKKSNFNTGSVIILILLLQLVKQCHARDWLNQFTPNSIEKKIKRDQLIERLKKMQIRISMTTNGSGKPIGFWHNLKKLLTVKK